MTKQIRVDRPFHCPMVLGSRGLALRVSAEPCTSYEIKKACKKVRQVRKCASAQVRAKYYNTSGRQYKHYQTLDFTYIIPSFDYMHPGVEDNRHSVVHDTSLRGSRRRLPRGRKRTQYRILSSSYHTSQHRTYHTQPAPDSYFITINNFSYLVHLYVWSMLMIRDVRVSMF